MAIRALYAPDLHVWDVGNYEYSGTEGVDLLVIDADTGQLLAVIMDGTARLVDVVSAPARKLRDRMRLISLDEPKVIYEYPSDYLAEDLSAMTKAEIQELANVYGFTTVNEATQTKDEMIAAFLAEAQT